MLAGMPSRLVYVSGAPGAGKTSLAFPLAAELGYSLATKDMIKETLHDVLFTADYGAPDRAWSQRLGASAMELLWALAGRAGDMVIEANFRPYSAYERERFAGLGTGGCRLTEVHCRCPAEVALARYNSRGRHPVHVKTTLPIEAMAEFDRPVGIGDLVTVDTTRPVDVAAVAERVRALHARA
jgi:predicted kinase